MKHSFLIGIGFLLLAGPALGAGTTGAAFLDIPVGAGPAAMGSAYGAQATNAYAPVWNPAGLGRLSGVEFAGQHVEYLESIHYEYLAAVIPLRSTHGLGVSAQHLGSGDIPSTDENGMDTGTHSDSYGAYTMAYGHSINAKLSLGLSGKWIRGNLDDVTAGVWAIDAGALWQAHESVTFSAVIRNMGPEMKFLNEGDPLPLAGSMGLLIAPSRRWRMETDLVIPRDSAAAVRVGGEWRPVDLLSLRLGYRTDTLKELSALAGFSMGIGLECWGQELAYAWVPYGDLGNTQYVSLVLRLGTEARKRRSLIQYGAGRHALRVRRQVEDEAAEPELMQLMELLDQGQSKERISQSPNLRGLNQ